MSLDSLSNDVDLKDYTYTIRFLDDAFVAQIKELPGCTASGESLMEFLENLPKSVRMYLRHVGKPITRTTISYRTSPDTHRKLTSIAEKNNLSVNSLIDELVMKGLEAGDSSAAFVPGVETDDFSVAS
jgi:hypothetical protein